MLDKLKNSFKHPFLSKVWYGLFTFVAFKLYNNYDLSINWQSEILVSFNLRYWVILVILISIILLYGIIRWIVKSLKIENVQKSEDEIYIEQYAEFKKNKHYEVFKRAADFYIEDPSNSIRGNEFDKEILEYFRVKNILTKNSLGYYTMSFTGQIFCAFYTVEKTTNLRAEDDPQAILKERLL